MCVCVYIYTVSGIEAGGIEQELKLKRDDDLDVAIGTFMTYGGKILRQIGVWAFNGTATASSDKPSEIQDTNTGIPG